MAYLAPIYRPSSVRHAIQLKFLDPDQDCLVVAKANRLEFYTQSDDGQLSLQHSRAIYGRVTMLQKLSPGHSRTDHLFVGTDRYMYFTLSWNPEDNSLKTEKKFESVADTAARERQHPECCHIDPTGRFMTIEIYEGIITVVPLVQRGKKRRLDSDPLPIGEPTPVRISEMCVRSSAFLHHRGAGDDRPILALLYEDNQANVRLKLRTVGFAGGEGVELEESDIKAVTLEPGSNLLIPINGPTYGLVILGETSITYYDDSTGEAHTEPLDDVTIFTAWERIDNQRFILADDYGQLYLFMLVVNDENEYESWKLDSLGKTSRANVLVYLDAGHVFVGSHQGTSQVIKISERSIEVVQEFTNIAPIVDFAIMDMGNRSTEGLSTEYSSGQARIVTGSGAYQDGGLRSVRSGVGIEELGMLGEIGEALNLFSLKTDPASEFVDVLFVTFVGESRVFKFDPDGDVAEVDEFGGLSLSETTLVASNVPHDRLLQVTSSRVQLTDLESGMVFSEWSAPNNQVITEAASNDTHVIVSLGGAVIVVLSIGVDGLKPLKEKKFDGDHQVSCLALPSPSSPVCFFGFWKNSEVSACSIGSLESIKAINISESTPRALLVTQIFEDAPPTLFIATSNGSVVTYSVNPSTYDLADRKSITLGTREARFQALPRGSGLFNVLATCEHPSLIYSFEGRMMYSAVTVENAKAVCPFNTNAYPGAFAIATAEDLRLALVDTERTTHVQSLMLHETVRRIAWSPNLQAFGLGTVKRILKEGEERLISHFKLVDEVLFKELDTYALNEDELVESVIRAELNDGSGEKSEKFVVGTSYLDHEGSVGDRGRVLILEVTEDRMLKLVYEVKLKGACRCLAMCDGKIVTGLIKTIVLWGFDYIQGGSGTPGGPEMKKVASFRCSTAPIDITVSGNTIAIGDLMKSVIIVKWTPGTIGTTGTLVEVARHYQTVWTTAIAEIGDGVYLQAEAEGNLLILERNVDGATAEDEKRLNASAEMKLGELVNRIRSIDVPTTPDAVVVPRAFIATTEGSIYLFGLIGPDYQNTLLTLQSNLADLVQSPGDVPFNKYRAYSSPTRSSDEPYRFVDADLIEQFLELDDEMQSVAINGLGMDVEQVKGMVEGLRRLR